MEKCYHCGQLRVVVKTIDNYITEFRHDGVLHQFTVSRLETPTCEACGEMVFNGKVDDQITDALRIHLGLLSSAEIRAELERLNLPQKDVAKHLGIAEATISRWVTDTQVQSRAMDNLLRAYFALDEMRSFLAKLSAR